MSTSAARRSHGSATLTTSLFALLFLAAALPATAASQDRYGYYRIVEGNATVVQGGDSQSAQENQPLLTGDRLWTPRGGRVEVVLADNTLLRVGADSEVSFEGLAGSGDGNSSVNLLTLRRGEVQLVTDGSGETRVDTDNASVYLHDAGNYRVESRDATTLLVVRAGRAEARTRRGAIMVDADEEAWIEDSSAPEVEAAGTLDSLEHWAANLDDQYQRARWDDDYVDSSLSYSSARMADYGSWVTVSNRRAWRPRVAADWSPYRHGRWAYTPSGLTWCSYEPWGWVPYHYGSWDYAPGWGWAWYPGYTYAPAWVYWYWGPSYVGWVPFGYYSHYYGPRWYGGYGHGYDYTWGFGRRVHGWAGGHHWDRWNFVDCNGVYDRRLSNRTRTAVQLGAQGELPRGIITTETRGLKPDVATRPSQGMLTLANNRSGWEKPIRELPDVSRFVARDPNVTAEVGRVALPVDRDRGTGVRGDKPGNGRSAPGEKPAIIGDNAGGDNVGGGGTRRATSRPDWRSGGGTGVGGADPNGTHSGRPAGSIEADWRGGNAGRGGDSKPGVGGRAAGEKPNDATPGDSTSGSWRRRPGDGNGGGNGRGASARVPAAGVSAKPAGPASSDSGSGGATEKPRGGASVGGARPSGGDDESWRGAGRETTSGGRPPVRRIVEGVRSNRQTPSEQRPSEVESRPAAEKPSPSYARARSAEPSGVAPRAQSPRPAPPSTSRPEPNRGRVERPQETRREGASSHGDDAGPSRGAAERGSGGDRGGRDHGGGGGARDDGGSHGSGGAHSRPADKDGGDPNR